jgi:hypothetical protein
LEIGGNIQVDFQKKLWTNSSGSWQDLTRATLRNIPEDGILHSHRRENLKSYIWNI